MHEVVLLTITQIVVQRKGEYSGSANTLTANAPGYRWAGMRLYHVTDRASGQLILEQGFQDAEVIHDDRELLIGVWLADRCLADEEDVGPRLGPVPDVALCVDVPTAEVEPYERRDTEKPYREFCVPARVVN